MIGCEEDDLLDSRSWFMRYKAEEDALTGQYTISTCQEDVEGGLEVSLDIATREPSISATFKHTCIPNNNDIMLGMSGVTWVNDHVIGRPLPPPVPDTTNDRDQANDHPGLVGRGSEEIPSTSSQDRSEEGQGAQAEETRVCSYLRLGVCRIHGPGARRCWRPIRTPAPGPGGRVVTRQNYYVCDVGPRGRGLID